MDVRQTGGAILSVVAVLAALCLPPLVSTAPALDPQKELRILSSQMQKVEKSMSYVGRSAKTLDKVVTDMEAMFKMLVENVTRLQLQRDVLMELATGSCAQQEGQRERDEDGSVVTTGTNTVGGAREQQAITTEATTTAQMPWYRDCSDVLDYGHTQSGVYTIYIRDQPVRVFCRMESGWQRQAWTLIQRRQDGSVDFQRTWAEYKDGFGDPASEYWLGNENIHALTTTANYKLFVYMEDWEGGYIHIQYDQFYLESERNNYRLRLGYLRGGNTRNAMYYNTGQPFTTFDRDNDVFGMNCGARYSGGWWYYGHACVYANLNGEYVQNGTTRDAVGLVWVYWKSPKWYSAKATEMRIMPLQP